MAQLAKVVRWMPVLLALCGVLLVACPAEACPMCKAALSNQDGEGGDLVSGFFYSILFMLSMPFAILGVFSGLMYREVRRARAAKEAATVAVQQPEGPLPNRE